MALGCVLEFQLLSSNAAHKLRQRQEFGQAVAYQCRGIAVILFLARAIKIVHVILAVCQAVLYFICELLKAYTLLSSVHVKSGQCCILSIIMWI